MSEQTNRQGKIVSLINMKGGVGKTTLAVGLAWELAQHYRVLLVDVDPQFNATQWLVDDEDYLAWLKSRHTVFDVYTPEGGIGGIGGFSRQRKKKKSPSLSSTVMGVTKEGTTLDLLPSSLELITLDAAPRGTENRLKLFLRPAPTMYDFTIIDCPPTASLFSYSAYIASDAYLVPVKPDPLSVLGLPLLDRTIRDYEERSGHAARKLGLVLTLVRGTNAMRTASADLRASHPDDVFAATMRQTTGVAEAVEAGSPLQLFQKTRTSLRTPLRKIADEFVKRIGA